jgi:hypothetical protein
VGVCRTLAVVARSRRAASKAAKLRERQRKQEAAAAKADHNKPAAWRSVFPQRLTRDFRCSTALRLSESTMPIGRQILEGMCLGRSGMLVQRKAGTGRVWSPHGRRTKPQPLPQAETQSQCVYLPPGPFNIFAMHVTWHLWVFAND